MTYSSDRLDRIEALLAAAAESNAASLQRFDRIEQSAEQRNREAEQRSREAEQRFREAEQRLTEIAEGLKETRAIADSNARAIAETRAITDSNARAIEAWGHRSEATIDDTNRRMEEAIADTVQMIADLGQRQQETDQRFEIFLAESRADRALAEQRHQAWLADSARLWQRVSE